VNDNEREWLRQFEFMQGRIPKLDAVTTFVRTGDEADPRIAEMHARTGFSRWFPVEGGHRVSFPYERGPFDESVFQIEHEAWDHETCKICRSRIDPMTLCWVTKSGPYVILCSSCHSEIVAAGPRT
jgi:hypothetical protein